MNSFANSLWVIPRAVRSLVRRSASLILEACDGLCLGIHRSLINTGFFGNGNIVSKILLTHIFCFGNIVSKVRAAIRALSQLLTWSYSNRGNEG